MIVYKTKDGKIVSVSTKGDDYILKENEYGSTVWYQKPYFTGTEVIESITQAEIDAQNTAQIKQNNINTYLQKPNCVWVGSTPNGLEDWAVMLGNDGKLSTVKVN